MRASVRDSHGSFVSAISPVSVDGFLPNFCHWCILGHRLPVYVLGSKVKVQGHTIAAEAHSTRRYRRVQLFLVFISLMLVSSRVCVQLAVNLHFIIVAWDGSCPQKISVGDMVHLPHPKIDPHV